MGFFESFIKLLLDEGHTVEIATNETERRVPECYREWKCKVHQIDTFRSPLHKGNFNAMKQIRRIVERDPYDIVHCHTPIAAMCTRIACRRIRKSGTKVFYTAHGFHFYKGAPLKNWLLYYPVEWLCAHFTDILITINQEDYAFAQKKMRAKKVIYVPGVGIDLDKFNSTYIDRSEKRKELGVEKGKILLFSVGELNANKNHMAVVKALAGMSNIEYMIAGRGDLKDELENTAKTLGVHLHLLGFRTDVAELYKACDIYILPSYREGLNVSLMEAMASGLPCIASDIRGNRDLICDFLFNPSNEYDDAKALVEEIEFLAQNKEIREEIGNRNRALAKQFSKTIVNSKMKEVYADI